MKKHLLSLIGCTCLVTISYSQELEVLSPAGEEAENANHQVSYTIGELVIESGASEENIVTQGYHQSKLTITGVGEIPDGFGLSVFPNPTSDMVILESADLSDIEKVTLYDMKGALIRSVQNTQSNRLTLDLTNIAAGTYHLVAKTIEHDQTLTYQIIKSH